MTIIINWKDNNEIQVLIKMNSEYNASQFTARESSGLELIVDNLDYSLELKDEEQQFWAGRRITYNQVIEG